MTEQERQEQEFPKGKDNYCPRCYFESEKKVLRSECPHNSPTQDLREKIEDCLMMRVVTAKPLKWEFYEKETVDRLLALFTAERDREKDCEHSWVFIKEGAGLHLHEDGRATCHILREYYCSKCLEHTERKD